MEKQSNSMKKNLASLAKLYIGYSQKIKDNQSLEITRFCSIVFSNLRLYAVGTTLRPISGDPKDLRIIVHEYVHIEICSRKI